MARRKVAAGLLAAGAVTVGLGGAALPASAETKTVVITLLGGQEIRVQLDIPDGTPLDQVAIPGIKLPIISVRVEGESSTPPPVTSPQPPVSTQPAAPAAAPEGAAPAGAPQAVAQKDQKASGKAKRRARAEHDHGAAGAPAASGDDASRGDRSRGGADGRADGGLPTPDNPGYAEALPGPAPIGVPNFFIEKFRIPPFLLPIYQAAGVQYGVRWEVLAAINEIETDYGRNLNVSSAGAVGWMQFLPSSWKAYGVDANRDGKRDPYNPVDAIFAAARYLKAAGAEDDLRKAVFAYNHADWYVDSVLLRARLIGGLPADLVGSLSGLTQGIFPVHARTTYADDLSEADAKRRVAKGRNAAVPVDAKAGRRSIALYAEAGAPVVAVQDGTVVRLGVSKRLGRFVQLRDGFGNTYTYGALKKVARAYPVPKKRAVSRTAIKRELGLSGKDAKPTAAATAGSAIREQVREAAAGPKKERLFANPGRPRAYKAGGEEQVLQRDGVASFGALTLDRKDATIKKLRRGSKVLAGTVLGRIGRTSARKAPHVRFEIRPAGRGAPRIDPKPILDGWKLLESTAVYRAAGKNPLKRGGATIGQILLMSKAQLQRAVADNPRIELYGCGRQDIADGAIDRRVLATLEFLAASGLKPTVTSLKCGHSIMTASGNVSHHSSGNAVDIAKVNGIPILGHQGPGSITDITIRRLLTLQGTMAPAQIISLMTFEGAPSTMALPDHADHIHVGFRPTAPEGQGASTKFDAALKPGQWLKLIDRLNAIDNPKVSLAPSKYAVPVPRPDRASKAHTGE
ncbi:lytic murein transglycosylase [Conexibacter sp. SYSU D00693]|uniref:lytic murein transglycosylase n=1 Tax=Conexibacter sp. SYSU D00693 TaxID=2812560 RepID=UPI00196ABE44|nr:lytic murein transglycosylase [Conexibacter sp. SYSU D00693]